MVNIQANKKYYIAGPMRGFENFNFDAFDHMHDIITASRGIPISPTDMDRLYEGWEWYPPKTVEITPELKRRCMQRDLSTILWDCDGMVMLKGWRRSLGAQAEHALAIFLGLQILYEGEDI